GGVLAQAAMVGNGDLQIAYHLDECCVHHCFRGQIHQLSKVPFELHSPGHAATPPSPKPMPHLPKELQREKEAGSKSPPHSALFSPTSCRFQSILAYRYGQIHRSLPESPLQPRPALVG